MHDKLLSQADMLEKTKASCESLLARRDVAEESKEDTQRCLSAMQEQYTKLMSTSSLRKQQLEKTKPLLDDFESVQQPFSDWLDKAEIRCVTLATASVVPDTLKVQSEQIKVGRTCFYFDWLQILVIYETFLWISC